MLKPDHHQQLGRAHQRPGLLTAGQITTLVALAGALGLLILWHLTLVITAGIPITGIGITLRGLLTAAPLDLPAGFEAADAGVTVAVYVLLCAAATGLCVWWAVSTPERRRRRRTGVGLADRKQTRRSAGEIRARTKAAHTRRASITKGLLDVDTAPLAEVGVLLGHATGTGEPVVLTLEDQVGIIAATGAGKTLYLMITAALDAPGPLIATSTKPEVLDAIVETRTAKGRVWVFDPLNVANWPEPMIWNPVTGAENSAAAVARGEAFAGGLAGADALTSSNPFFRSAAAIIIARLLHAAALSGSTMVDVVSWALDLERSTTARDILSRHPDAEMFWAHTLRTASEGADETLSSVRMTLGQKVEPILNRTVMRQMLPTPGVAVFDPARFVQSTDTLVLITDDQAQTNVAPLTTMLLNEVLDAAKAHAARSMTGRLDPPLRIAGDEIANVAPVPKLPGNLSDSRGVGIQWFAAFQSVAQIIARWGEDDGRQILANLNCSVIMGGLQDEKALDRFSALVGDTDVTEVTSTLNAANTATGRNVTTTERTALRAEEIRLIPDGQALVIYRNAPAMIIDPHPLDPAPGRKPDRRRHHPGPDRPHHPPAMTNTTEPAGERGTDVPGGGDPGMTAEDQRDQLALLWNGFEELTARLDTTEDTIAGTLDKFGTDIDDLKTKLAQVLKKEQGKDIRPRRWAARATRQDWADLIDWVEHLNTDYSLLDDHTIPPCWQAHPGVVEELAGLWRSWTRTMIIDETAEGSGDTSLTAWHDRWLWPALTRMKTGHYRTTNCRDQHIPEHPATTSTNR